MKISLNRQTERLISILENNGYEAFAVGGCVRDSILGREVTDFDIATSARPEEIKMIFSSLPVIETGIKHGTVTVIMDKIPFEITTYRTETGYTDSRHPDTVNFVRSIYEDLARRDFTMNAIAYSPKAGVIDPFFGAADIKSGIIRAVGNPKLRFSEDALRIIRALRFSSVLSFEIESETSDAIFELRKTLKKVSAERIFNELKKLICGKNAVFVIENYQTVLSELFPICGSFESLKRLPEDFPMRFTALCGSASAKALDVLKADNFTKRLSELLLDSKPIPNDITELKHYISRLGREKASYVAIYRRALYSEDLNCLTEKVVNSDECISISELKVNGNDLISLGIKGRNVGRVLFNLLCDVIDGIVKNEKELLLEKAKDIDIL